MQRQATGTTPLTEATGHTLGERIMNLVGEGPATALFAQLGGENYRVPTGRDRISRRRMADLRLIMGPEAAERFIEVYHGQTLFIPLGIHLDKRRRNERIRRFVADRLAEKIGKRQAVIRASREFGIGVRTIYKVLADA